jgi:hypothetical protein
MADFADIAAELGALPASLEEARAMVAHQTELRMYEPRCR